MYNKKREIHRSFCGQYSSYEWIDDSDGSSMSVIYYNTPPDNGIICKSCIRFRGNLKPVQLSLLEEF